MIDFDNKKGNEQLALTLKKINEFLLERPLESTTEIENEFKFSDKQLWMLSITAIYRTYEESYEFNTLQDKLATSLTRGVSKEKLKNQWHIHNLEDLMAEVKELEKKESVEEFGEAYMIWDYARIFMLVRLAFDLKWINEQEFWQLLATYAPEIQQSYNGWKEMATAFLQARKLWAGSEITQQNQFEKLIEKLLNNPSSVWNNVSWNTDLTT
ncbi:DUF1266 domain-containing protein [Flavobacterium sp. CBA20B-1]|uniref:DUF1266 domain-containing protein n=1 Tax=unclassified Flavobacterium TaxID=196869 RepID=UPI0022253DCB|nr:MULTISPECIES: DUF1266 domain-containing protein [unclassified Flavobacterium]WCM43325.1 DUF1266 domain-containing protein [Flavobacterium sp. CBA20B-1]